MRCCFFCCAIIAHANENKRVEGWGVESSRKRDDGVTNETRRGPITRRVHVYNTKQTQTGVSYRSNCPSMDVSNREEMSSEGAISEAKMDEV